MLPEILSKTRALYENLSSYQDKVTCTMHSNGKQIDKYETQTFFNPSEEAISFVVSELQSFDGGNIVGKKGVYKQQTDFFPPQSLPTNSDINEPVFHQYLTKQDLVSCCSGNNFIMALLTKNHENSWFRFPQDETEVNSWHEAMLHDKPCYCLQKQTTEANNTEAHIQHALQELQGKVDERALEVIRNMPIHSDDLTRYVTYWIDKQSYAIVKIETKTLDLMIKGSVNEDVYDITATFNQLIPDSIFEA